MKFRIDDMFAISGLQLMLLVDLTSYDETAKEIADVVLQKKITMGPDLNFHIRGEMDEFSIKEGDYDAEDEPDVND